MQSVDSALPGKISGAFGGFPSWMGYKVEGTNRAAGRARTTSDQMQNIKGQVLEGRPPQTGALQGSKLWRHHCHPRGRAAESRGSAVGLSGDLLAPRHTDDRVKASRTPFTTQVLGHVGDLEAA